MALREAGLSARAIGRYVGRHTSTIDQWLRRNGAFGYIRHPLSPAERATINRMLRDGESLSDIARAIGRPVATVRGYGLSYGTYRNQYWRRPAAEVDGMVSLYERGVPLADIRAQFSASDRQIYYWLGRRGIEPNRQQDRVYRA